MKLKKKHLYIIGGVILSLILVGYALYTLMNLRTFQFFGELVSRVDTEEKVIALTFDDAPTLQSNEVLNILKEKNIKATFFAIGSNIEEYPEQAKALVAAGMEIGNHSYSHERMVFKPMSFYQEEVEKTNKLIREIGYTATIHFRPPTGKKLLGLPWYLSQQKIKTIMWDVEPDTFAKRNSNNFTVDFLLEYTLENTKPGSIILLHPFCDVAACAIDREALPKIIDELQAKGYKFVTVSELLTYQKTETPL